MKVGRLILAMGSASPAAPPLQRMDVRADGGVVGPGIALRLPPPFHSALVLGWDKRMSEAPLILKGGPIRRFSDVGLQTLIDRQIETLPPDVTGVSIKYQYREDEHRVAVLGRLGRLGWTVAADFPSSGGKPGVEGEICFKW